MKPARTHAHYEQLNSWFSCTKTGQFVRLSLRLLKTESLDNAILEL